MHPQPEPRDRRFIESPLFPVEAVMAASAREKGPGRPPFWEMLFWWTRKPLAGARALLLAATLTEEEVLGPHRDWRGRGLHPGVRRFLQAIYPSIDLARSRPPTEWSFKRTPHYDNPQLPREWREKVSKMSVADPMAGYGNIPLEALRLGFGSVYYWDLLPIARLILRAVLEYPAKYGEQLARDVKRYGEELIRRLREDPDLQELYDPETAVYIGTWEVRCPYCGRYTPLVGNWWLARVKEKTKDGKTRFKALAWMHPHKNPDGTITIQIKDLTPKLKNAKQVQVTKTTVKIDGETYQVPEPNINARTRTATCLYCGAKIRPPGKNQEWPVRQAVREWNQNLDRYLEGEITLEQLLQSPARPTIIAKVKTENNQLTFYSATKEDQQKLWRALEKIKQQYPDPDIPTEPTPSYENRRFIYPFGFDKWYKLFNPRQLLTHIKTIKYIRQIAKQIMQKQQKQGKTPEQTKLYVESIITYITISFLKFIDFNSIQSHWTTTWLIPNEALAMRGITMTWNTSEQSVYYIKTGSIYNNINNIIKSILYLSYIFKIN